MRQETTYQNFSSSDSHYGATLTLLPNKTEAQGFATESMKS